MFAEGVDFGNDVPVLELKIKCDKYSEAVTSFYTEFCGAAGPGVD
jgi:hypothetical protein